MIFTCFKPFTTWGLYSPVTLAPGKNNGSVFFGRHTGYIVKRCHLPPPLPQDIPAATAVQDQEESVVGKCSPSRLTQRLDFKHGS